MSNLDQALSVFDNLVPDSEWETRAKARGLLRGYDAKYRDQVERMVGCEEEFIVPIWNLQSKGKKPSRSRSFQFAGKRDKEILRNSRLWLMDHKTTSEGIQDPDATYWRQLSVNSQASWYLLSAHYQGMKVAGIIWDVIRKPAIKPKAIAKAMQKSIAAGNQYCGFDVSENGQAYVIKHGRENAELYENRVARETIDNPDKYYQRKPVMRLLNEMVDDCLELWQLSKDALYSRSNACHPRNSNACLTYGTPCQYLGICSGYDEPDSDNWQPRKRVHDELDTLPGDGRDVLTTSRLGCYQTCKRKHHYRYVQGIERRGREPSAALQFGTNFHAALDVWWQQFAIS